MKVIINLSNHHIHLSREDLDILFGKNYKLKNLHDLMQPGQFAAQEIVKVVGPKGEIEMRVLGPLRKQTQCEIMLGDSWHLGIKNPVIRLSGDLKNSSPFTILGPVGKVEKKEGLIVAKRHIHLDPQTAKSWQVIHGQEVALRAGLDSRQIVFEDVIIRVSEKFVPECHIDFEEGDAAGIKNGDLGWVLFEHKKDHEFCFSND